MYCVYSNTRYPLQFSTQCPERDHSHFVFVSPCHCGCFTNPVDSLTFQHVGGMWIVEKGRHWWGQSKWITCLIQCTVNEDKVFLAASSENWNPLVRMNRKDRAMKIRFALSEEIEERQSAPIQLYVWGLLDTDYATIPTAVLLSFFC